MTKAVITGITGQDGSYLTDLLLQKDYEVHGIVRRTSSIERSRLVHHFRDPEIYNKKLFLHYADLDDPTTLRRIINSVQPQEMYHLAGQSHVALSFEIPESTCHETALGTLRILEILRDMPSPPKFLHVSSSEIFGKPAQSPQDENTAINPVTPYGCAKAFATQIVKVYRDSFKFFACNVICYNHESPRRGENFVTRKICRAAAMIKLGLAEDLVLGAIDAQRDWGDARDTVHGMWLAMQHSEAGDYVFATGKLHSVKDLLQIAFDAVGLNWKDYVKQNASYVRRDEPVALVGNPRKAAEILGWHASNNLTDLIKEMTLNELSELKAHNQESIPR